METLETVTVYSPVEDKGIKKNLDRSPIWKQAIHPDELADAQEKGKPLFEYTMKFEGTNPVQVTKVKKIVN